MKNDMYSAPGHDNKNASQNMGGNKTSEQSAKDAADVAAKKAEQDKAATETKAV